MPVLADPALLGWWSTLESGLGRIINFGSKLPDIGSLSLLLVFAFNVGTRCLKHRDISIGRPQVLGSSLALCFGGARNGVFE